MPRDVKTLDAGAFRLLDDGLEPEPSVLAPAPLVITVIRAGSIGVRDVGLDQTRHAHPADVFLALVDMGLRDQAVQYARAARS